MSTQNTHILHKILLSLPAAMLVLGTAAPAFAAGNQTFPIQGANISPASPSDFGSASMYQSLKNLKADHATSVTLIVPLLQSNVTSTDIGTSWNTPTDDSLITAIKEAHSLGLVVTLKPHDEVLDGAWRANIDPTNRTEWFTNYGSALAHYGAIAQANGVEQIVLGTELIDVSSATHNASNTQNWYDLIARIRTVYSGKLGYASNWGGVPYDEMNQIQFWDKLDFIGVDLYYTHAVSSETVAQMVQEFKTWDTMQLAPLQQKFNKPVEFTELGYRSVADANIQPFNWEMQGPVDLQDQATAYQAVFTYWSTVPYVKGLNIWQWNSDPYSGGTSDTDYTPQGKPAETILAAWYGGNGSSQSIQGALQPLTASSTLSVSSTTPGTPITLTTRITNSGTYDQQNMLVDTELYSQDGSKVFQQFSSAQNIIKGQSNTYTYTWTPSVQGTYTVKVGVFSNDWGHAYTWNDAASTLLVQDQAVPPTITPVTGILSAVVNSISTTIGSLIDIVTTISNGGSTLPNALIDTEVYDAQGNKVSQQFTPNQSLSTGTQLQYHSSFTPTASGVYRIAVGVFTNNWATNALWQNQAGSIYVTTASVASTTPGTPATPVATTTPPVATSTPPLATTTPLVATSTPPVATTTTPVATTTPPTPVTTTPTPSPASATGIISGSTSARVGTSVNFIGRNFGHEENVTITINGDAISSTPHADGGGNFSTGSLPVLQQPGHYTYTFTGMISGITGTVGVDITP